MEKKHITHHNLQHLSAHLLQHSTLIPASNLYKFQTIFLHPFCYMPGLAQASLRSGIPMPNRHSQKTGGAVGLVGLIMLRVELQTPLFAVWKKKCQDSDSTIFCQFFFPRKSHYGVYDIVDTTLPWHACDGQVGSFRATKIGLSASSCHVTGIDLRDPGTQNGN